MWIWQKVKLHYDTKLLDIRPLNRCWSVYKENLCSVLSQSWERHLKHAACSLLTDYFLHSCCTTMHSSPFICIFCSAQWQWEELLCLNMKENKQTNFCANANEHHELFVDPPITVILYMILCELYNRLNPACTHRGAQILGHKSSDGRSTQSLYFLIL